MSARLKYFRPENRLLRGAYDAALDIREDTRDGVDRKADAAKLMRAIAAISEGIGQGAALHRSKVQYVQNIGINAKTPAIREHLKSLGSVGISGMIPAIIARANSGDEDGVLYASAMVSVLGEMPQDKRPMTPTKFARMISVPDYDKASVELEECRFMLDALAVMLPRLANGQLPTATDMITIGEKQRQLRDGEGLRDAETLADDDAELGLQPEEETPNDPAPDSVQHDDTPDDVGPNSERQADPPSAEPAPAGEDDANAEDRPRSEGSTGAQ